MVEVANIEKRAFQNVQLVLVKIIVGICAYMFLAFTSFFVRQQGCHVPSLGEALYLTKTSCILHLSYIDD